MLKENAMCVLCRSEEIFCQATKDSVGVGNEEEEYLKFWLDQGAKVRVTVDSELSEELETEAWMN